MHEKTYVQALAAMPCDILVPSRFMDSFYILIMRSTS